MITLDQKARQLTHLRGMKRQESVWEEVTAHGESHTEEKKHAGTDLWWWQAALSARKHRTAAQGGRAHDVLAEPDGERLARGHLLPAERVVRVVHQRVDRAPDLVRLAEDRVRLPRRGVPLLAQRSALQWE